MAESRLYIGSIEDVLYSGEYDQGDLVQVAYDELSDLVEQGKEFRKIAAANAVNGGDVAYVQRVTNRPIHPCLGGDSPYTGFLKLRA
jgi:hypothetical protein